MNIPETLPTWAVALVVVALVTALVFLYKKTQTLDEEIKTDLRLQLANEKKYRKIQEG